MEYEIRKKLIFNREQRFQLKKNSYFEKGNIYFEKNLILEKEKYQ